MRATGHEAFTFVEILAALAFLGILMPVVLSALMVSNRAGLTSERSIIASELAENKLGELMIDEAWSSAGSRGDFGTDHPGYRWEITQKDWQNGSMVELTLGVFYQVQGKELEVKFSTLVSQE